MGKFKLALLVDDERFLKWQEECVNHLISNENVELCLIIKNQNPTSTNSGFNSGIYRAIRKYLVRPSLQQKGRMIGDLLPAVSTIKVTPEKRSKFTDRVSEKDIDLIRAYKLDVILRFGFNILKGEILSASRYGVWSFHHADEAEIRGLPVGFWEIYNRSSTTGSILQRITEQLDAGYVLKKGLAKTLDFSLSKNIDNALEQSIRWPSEVIELIRSGEFDINGLEASESSAPLYTYPNIFQLFIFGFLLLRNKINNLIDKLVPSGVWSLRMGRGESVHSLNCESFLQVQKVPLLEFQADPMLLKLDDNRILVLYERFSFLHNKGEIYSAVLDQNGAIIKSPECFHSEQYHLSYPFLFEHDDIIYYLPEKAAANRLDLYKIDKSTLKPVLLQTLIEGRSIVDPTLTCHNGKWWLFCTDKDDRPNQNLYLWWANELLGEWVEHRANPIKSNVKSSRPAGPLLRENGKLLRVAQDCSRSYGGSMVLMEVERLDEKRFGERAVGLLEVPGVAVHTLSGLNDIGMWLIDARERTYNPLLISLKVYQQFRKLFRKRRLSR